MVENGFIYFISSNSLKKQVLIAWKSGLLSQKLKVHFLDYSLRDDSVDVRKTAITILTHLILNDMIKVKGQISEMAICLEDKEEKIAGAAKLLFSELAQKVGINDNFCFLTLHSSPEKKLYFFKRFFNLWINMLFSFVNLSSRLLPAPG